MDFPPFDTFTILGFVMVSTNMLKGIKKDCGKLIPVDYVEWASMSFVKIADVWLISCPVFIPIFDLFYGIEESLCFVVYVVNT